MNGTLQFPVELGEATIEWARISVKHSAQRRELVVTLCGGAHAGRQTKNYGFMARPVGEDTVEIDTYGAVQPRIPLREWQAFADRLEVHVSAVSATTIELTPQLVQMARDVVAKRRDAPTDDEWAAELAAGMSARDCRLWTDHGLVRLAVHEAGGREIHGVSPIEIRRELIRRGWEADDLLLIVEAGRRWAEADAVVREVLASSDWDWPRLRAAKADRRAAVEETYDELCRRHRARWEARHAPPAQPDAPSQLSLF